VLQVFPATDLRYRHHWRRVLRMPWLFIFIVCPSVKNKSRDGFQKIQSCIVGLEGVFNLIVYVRLRFLRGSN
jgi:hypothetical protein